MLYQDQETKKYQPGSLVAALGTAVFQSLETHLVTIAQPYLDELSIKTGEGVALEILSGESSILAYQMPAKKRSGYP
jgi:DNA-binding IclR family transcriptional regulator